MASLASRRGPLALSADGHWRLHVDGMNVLHRVSLADGRESGSLSLPAVASGLSASRSGQRVVVSTELGCIGLADFGGSPGSTPTFRWLAEKSPVPVEPKLASDQTPVSDAAACGRTPGMRSPVALSTDGRWLATSSQVRDIDTGEVIASLPFNSENIGGRHLVRLQFVDGNARLLVVTATMGEGYEGPSSPSALQFAVWDLAGKGLHRLISRESNVLFLPQALFTDFSPRTGALYWVDTERYAARRQFMTEGETPPPLDVMQTPLGVCAPVSTRRFQMAEWAWSSLSIDPLGRWIAGMRKIDPATPEGREGQVEELVVHDLGTGRQIARRLFKKPLLGLVAAFDGAALYGLTPLPIRPADGSRPPAQTGVPEGGGEVVRIDIDLRRVTAPKLDATPWQAAACKLEDEDPTEAVRVVQGTTRRLQPIWTRPVDSVADLRRQALATAGVTEAPACDEHPDGGTTFLRKDGSLWLNRQSSITQLDLRSGQPLRTLPTRHKLEACAMPVPAIDSFLIRQGDTLARRPFDADAADAPPRRTIDVRRGWSVVDLAVGVHRITAYWRANPGTDVGEEKNGQRQDMRKVTYDAATQRRLKESAMGTDDYEMGGGDVETDGQQRSRPACHDDAGPMTSGYDWRMSHYDSFRAHACGPAPGQSRTVFWSHLDIAPSVVGAGEASEGPVRRTWAQNGAIAVAQDGVRLRVFDLASRRELAQVVLSAPGAAQSVQLVGSDGLLLVESLEASPSAESGQLQRHLRMYSFRP